MDSRKKVKIDNINFLTHKPYSNNYYQILSNRQKLPIWEYQFYQRFKEEFLKMYRKNQVMIVEGETGSGKTTQIPTFILESHPDETICVTQPRRVAAMSISQRVAEELDVVWGQEVGYTIRFEDKTSEKTKIKYMTDGMLLREAMNDSSLLQYNCIILDEIHERTLNTDILMGLLKELLEQRSELKLVLMSATLNTGKFSNYFDKAPLLQVSGRQFPVEVIFTETPQEDYLNAAIQSVLKIHYEEPEGDILVFLTGEEEIEQACEEIRNSLDDLAPFHLQILPLYSTLSNSQQQLIFKKADPGCRKCVIATNIAETSITIDGVVYVIDPGFSKQKVYNPRLGVESLLVSPISQASARQRSGRAGRTKAGKCYRLYTEQSFKEELIPETYPEILRSNLANVIIQLKKLGVTDLVHFDFLDPPSPETLMRGLEELYFLGALDENGNLSPLGDCIAEIPLEPKLAKILLSSAKVMDEMIILASMLSVPNVFVRPWDRQKVADQYKRKISHPDSDHISLINVYRAYKYHQENQTWCKINFINYRAVNQADKIRRQLQNILERLEVYRPSSKQFSSSKYFDCIKKALLRGFFMNISHLQKNRTYMTIKDQQVVLIHPSSVIAHRPNFVLFNEFAITKKNYMRVCSRVDVQWFFVNFRLLEIQPEYMDGIKLFETKKEFERAKLSKEKKINSASKIINEMCIWVTKNGNSYFTVDPAKSKYKL